MAGLKFRRQHPIGPYFADFACIEKKFAVELDGGYHDRQYDQDRQRQTFLESEGWQVLRFSNEDVLADVEAVAISIARQMNVELVFRGKRVR
jgi:very-short-patch-repair endonuclease